MHRSSKPTSRSLRRVAIAGALVASCSPAAPPVHSPTAPAASSAVPVAPKTVTLSILETNDLHGRIDRLPVFAGYLKNLRASREADHGGVVLVDCGDMFQGTLESNLGEGAAVIKIYNALGYTSATIGNHEFDYGPAGPLSTPHAATDDPRGALKARAQEASFPFLVSNLVETSTEKPLALPNAAPSRVLEVAGIRVGIVGAASMETLRTTAHANVADLKLLPILPTVVKEAERLRTAEHATVIVVALHAGANCESTSNPRDLSSCTDGELIKFARELPPGLVDVVVGGHTHHPVAHDVNGVAVIESWAQGRAFGRVDLSVDGATGRVTARAIQPPKELCADDRAATCEPGAYEGHPVVADAAIAEAIKGDLQRAEAEKNRSLVAVVETPLTRARDKESALGNLLTDLMREARAGTDVAVLNGGGIRANLPAGTLTYGALYEVFPFDNRFAKVKMKVAALKKLLASNLQADAHFLSFSGVQVVAKCGKGGLEIELRRTGGRKLNDDELLTVLASDFLMTGGDSVFAAVGVQESSVEIENDPPLREVLAEVLSRGTRKYSAESLLPPGKPRLSYPGTRPVHCGTLPPPPVRPK